MKRVMTPRLMMAVSMAIFGTLGVFVRNIPISSGELALYRAILAALLMYPAIQYLIEDHFLPGQNYTSIVSVTSETEGQTIP